MIYLYGDVIYKAGGIETYLHALATHLKEKDIPFKIAVSEQERSPIVDELVGMGISTYRQRIIPGDRWHLRKRALNLWLRLQLAPGDWVFCVRQPMPELYLELVRAVHARGAKIAASWIFAPEFLKPPAHLAANFCQAIRETDAVISVSQCTVHQFASSYGYDGPVHVVNYHNIEFCPATLPLPVGGPLKIGYMGRLEIYQKNLDTILESFSILAAKRHDVELHIYGGGPDADEFSKLARADSLDGRVFLHGPYDHRRDLNRIISSCHIFIYTSRFEGGPCFSLLELMQAGRFVVTSPVGGIPDIYAGRPDLGVMVTPDDPAAMANALDEALEKVASGKIDAAAIRASYDERFSMQTAHRAWLASLGMVSGKYDEK
jgi:glycosyltransferase involved in cell wall biosynthesis